MTRFPGPIRAQDPAPAPLPLLSVRGLAVDFDGPRSRIWGPPSRVRVLEDISFDLAPGETLGLVGESGSGKSTLGRAVLRRLPLADGRIVFDGRDITHLPLAERRALSRDIQMVFQDPYTSLNPRMTVLELIAEPLIVHGLAPGPEAARDRVAELLRLVNLPPENIDRFPHGFSGGQRQRIGIARALALRPKLIIADEPVSALDVSVRAQVVNLMQDLQQELGISYLFVAHDLSIVRHISHRIAILHRGRMVEMADCDTLYDSPAHPYTSTLLQAVPEPDPRHRRGTPTAPPPAPRMADLVMEGGACRYCRSCPKVADRCHAEAPALARQPGRDRWVACWEA
ncbi:ABC transporter ATP-binding protein [Mangrovicoccus algicola]|uniref:ABC transporter ATP-binding protein n=1 Tax=Mangrovicoccus algicola TaxID=2771008 RepID=A0A8J6Z838_9RHOB|nr:oligopeptide/dipeptide ABC transporter ATP-binding protein [Mangrovicoccus algicola]MBE3638165.1 ABC transporter ATP-binding protein [Mangrovicoccus algicola]